ncbi:MAG: hypothetical protein WA655_16840 [Candidatus Korobacteraceae bacterium]
MHWRYKTWLTVIALTMALVFSIPAVAQGPSDSTVQDQGPNAPAPQKTTTAADDDGWHFAITPYLWFAGASGTVGALGHDVSIHASPGDLLSHFDIGLMGVVEARKNRFVLPVDFLWIRLQADKGIPFEQDLSSIQLKATETILTPKVGYRIVDHEKVKVDALIGLRYWHLGQNLSFQPSGILSNLSQSANWVDAIAGGKIEMALSPKALITITGDAGGGGSDLDYQVAGLLGYLVGKKCVLQAGWRYLYVNYRTNPPALFVYDAHMSGALLGVTFNLK